MLVGMFLMVLGGVVGKVSSYQSLYCDCLRSSFEGKVCQEIKGDESQGSCHK